MHHSAPPVRTDHDAAIADATLHDLIAERLRQAPWLLLSAAAHAIGLLLLWILLPPEEVRRPEHQVQVADTEMVELAQPVPEPLPQPQAEETPEPVVVEPVPIDDRRTESDDDHTSDRVTKDSAFDFTGTNTMVGTGGGAAGPYGRRGRRGGPPGGTPPPAYEAIDAALRWLRDHQDEDGKWDCDQFMKHDDATGPASDGPGNAVHDVGVTGLALLAFLGDGNTMRSGRYQDTVRRGVLWLRSQQQENGLFGTNASHDFIYDHAIAAYAMCEAFGLSQYTLLEDTAQKGINYLESHRNPYSVWRYQPRDNDNDTSVTGWCIMAYESGGFFGLTINKEALKLCAVWLDQVSDPTGLHGYSKQGEPSSRKPGDHATRFPPEKGASMTAVGLFCRCFMGQSAKEKPVMNAAADLIAGKPPMWDEKGGTIDHYYWYYASYALFQIGGARWTAWQKQLQPVLLKNQHRDRANMNLHGSWDPKCAWGEDGGRVYSTAILALTLQANYRYTRLVR